MSAPASLSACASSPTHLCSIRATIAEVPGFSDLPIVSRRLSSKPVSCSLAAKPPTTAPPAARTSVAPPVSTPKAAPTTRPTPTPLPASFLSAASLMWSLPFMSLRMIAAFSILIRLSFFAAFSSFSARSAPSSS